MFRPRAFRPQVPAKRAKGGGEFRRQFFALCPFGCSRWVVPVNHPPTFADPATRLKQARGPRAGSTLPGGLARIVKGSTAAAR
ncbi:hypothetical protein AHIS1636_29700 [Arthrobacter mangrovi]|uniref:Uncharacterized protein n=1 Tax=Arthrobacter mangrovi TaxID=2966350 RepID=A0ABQ5MX49_9MICC|nr:hypothetical protein AHIS1636_29700 [Arthrobacter mangrovi]